MTILNWRLSQGDRGKGLHLALGLRGCTVPSGYSITLYLLALLALVISLSLSPVWRDAYKCNGLIQDTGGSLVLLLGSFCLAKASSSLTVLAASPCSLCAKQLSPGLVDSRGYISDRALSILTSKGMFWRPAMTLVQVAPEFPAAAPEALPIETWHRSEQARTYRLAVSLDPGGDCASACTPFGNLSCPLPPGIFCQQQVPGSCLGMAAP